MILLRMLFGVIRRGWIEVHQIAVGCMVGSMVTSMKPASILDQLMFVMSWLWPYLDIWSRSSVGSHGFQPLRLKSG